MTDSSGDVGELSHWEEVDGSGRIMGHLVAGDKLLKAPRWISSAFERRVVPREKELTLADFDLPIGFHEDSDMGCTDID
jgi:hypothetical protein